MDLLLVAAGTAVDLLPSVALIVNGRQVEILSEAAVGTVNLVVVGSHRGKAVAQRRTWDFRNSLAPKVCSAPSSWAIVGREQR